MTSTKSLYDLELKTYYDIFLRPVKTKHDLERISSKTEIAKKTIETLKKLGVSEHVEKEELASAQEFFEEIFHRGHSLLSGMRIGCFG